MSSSSSASVSASSFLTSTTLGIGIGLASAYVAQALLPGLSVRGFAAASASSSNSSGPHNGRSVSMAMTEDVMASTPRFELPLPLRSTRKNPPLSVSALTNKQNLEHLDVDGKRILMRVDYNVKVKNGVVQDRSRIDGTIPTLKHLLSVRGPKGGVKCIVLITHLGRPTGPDSVEYSLEPVARCLQHDYFPSTPVRFLPDCVGAEIEREIAMCEPGTIFVCENLRFHPEETGIRLTQVSTASGVTLQKERVPFAEKVRFREALSRLGDVFVFEAFGAAHRPHSSIIGIDLPQRAAGLLMAKEMSYYSRVLGDPARPFLAIVGGSKVSDKILVLENLLNIVDEMIIGGGMAYTFLKVLRDVRIGKSLFDEPGAKLVHRIMAKAADRNVRIHLPDDHIIGDRFSNDAKIGVTSNEEGIPDTWMGLDIGPRTRLVNSEVMQRAKTILWNGPLGVYELGPFGGGTLAAMQDMVEATKRGATTIIGGGDTGSASKYFLVGTKRVSEQVSWVSTGGGSSLVLMEGKELPAVTALSNIGDNSRPPAPDESKEPVDDEDD